MRKKSSFVQCGQLLMATVFVALCQASSANSLALTYPDTASVFYPLAIGDYWEYFDYADFGGGIVDTVSKLVRGDTTIGTRGYKVIRSRSFRYHVQSDSFERSDSVGNVYAYSSGTESLSFRFSDTSSTPWTIGSSLRR